MDLDSNAYFKLSLPNRDENYKRIIKALTLLKHNMMMKHQECGALVFVVY
jgi:hypothetical protein